MTVYYIGMYDIVDGARFQSYPPGVMALLPKYGGRVFASDRQAIAVEGRARGMTAIIEFPSADAALGLYNDPAYAALKRIRQESTADITMVLAHRLEPSP